MDLKVTVYSYILVFPSDILVFLFINFRRFDESLKSQTAQNNDWESFRYTWKFQSFTVFDAIIMLIWKFHDKLYSYRGWFCLALTNSITSKLARATSEILHTHHQTNSICYVLVLAKSTFLSPRLCTISFTSFFVSLFIFLKALLNAKITRSLASYSYILSFRVTIGLH